MIKLLYSEDGITFVELLVALVIFGVVVAIASTMIIQAYGVFDSSTRRMSASQLAELAQREISGYLRTVRGENLANTKDGPVWNYEGIYPYASDKKYVDYVFNFDENNNTLTVEVFELNSTDLVVERVFPNVVDFWMDSTEDIDSILIFIEIDDGSDTVTKRISIKFRNV